MQDIKVQAGETAYRLIGPQGQEGEVVEYGIPAKLELYGSAYMAYMDPFAELGDEATEEQEDEALVAAQTGNVDIYKLESSVPALPVLFDFEDDGDDDDGDDDDTDLEPGQIELPEEEEEAVSHMRGIHCGCQQCCESD